MISYIKQFIFVTIFIVFLSNLLSSYELKILENNNNVKVIISDISYNFNKKDNLFALNSNDIYTTKINENSDGILLPFIIPNRNYTINITLSKTYFYSNFIDNLTLNDDFQFTEKLLKYQDYYILYISINPIKKSNNKIEIAQEIVLDINFNFNFLIENTRQGSFLRDYILNKRHFDYLSSITKPNNSILVNDNWYSNNTQYLKINTFSDDIYIIKADSVLKYLPDFNNTPKKNIHLIHKGIDQYLAFKDGNQGNFNPNSDIIFLGKRPYGDTTWLNSYSHNTSFFLYKDLNSNNLIFNDFPIISADKPINEVEFEKHFEEEYDYAYGYDYIQTRTVKGEYWLWKIIEPYYDHTFFYNLDFVPADLQTNSYFKIAFSSVRLNSLPNWFRGHHYRFDFNDNKISDSIVKDGDYYIIDNQVNNKIYNFTGNSFKFRTTGVLDTNMALATNDHIGLDYFELKTKIKPILTKDVKNFKIKNLSDNSKLNISNFYDENIIIIDTLNKFIQFNKAQPELLVRSFTTKTDSMSKFIIGDSIFQSEKKLGLFVLVFNDINKAFSKSFFINNASEASDYIKKITNKDIVIASYNSNNLAQSTKDALISLGFQKIKNLNNNQIWLGAINIEKNEIYEEISSSEFINLISSFNASNITYKSFLNLASNKDYDLFLSDFKRAKSVEFEKVNKSNLKSLENQADLVIITHPIFKSGVDSLLNIYRTYTKSIKPFVAYIDDIYKEFNFGIKSVFGIKNFVQYALINWKSPKPKYFLIVGDANYDARNVMNNSNNIDYVPSYGWPYSDFWYLFNNDSINEIVNSTITRLTVKNNQQIFDYIDKLKNYYTSGNAPWKKTFLMISGGNKDEREIFKSYLEYAFSPFIVRPELCGDTTIVSKQEDNIVGESDGVKIIEKINNGAGFTLFLGHGSPTVFDVDGWNAPYLNNKNKYGILSTISCNSSAYAEQNIVSRNEEYVLAKDKGFIASGGSSFVTNVILGAELQNNLTKFLADTNLRMRNFAEILNLVKYQMLALQSNFTFREAYAYQYNIIGDPLISFYPSKYTDLYLLKEYININDSKNPTITEDEYQVKISGTVFNNGFRNQNPFRIYLIRTYNQKSDTLKYNFKDICFKNEFLVNLIVKDMPGVHNIKIIADPDNFYFEDDKTNNIIEFKIDVLKKGLLAFEPNYYWNVNSSKPEFRVINPVEANDILFEFEIREPIDSSYIVVKSSTQNEITITENYIDWKPNISLSNQKSYYFAGRYIINQIPSKWLEIPFTAINLPIQDSVIARIISKYDLHNLNKNNISIVENKDSIKLIPKYNVVPIKVESSFLDSTRNNIRWCNIEVNNTYIIRTQSEHIVPRGFNLVLISSDNGEVISKHQVDTWDENNVTQLEDFMRFIRDTVTEKEIMLFSICDRAFNIPLMIAPKESLASIDSIRFILKKLGSKLADSISFSSSYAFVASKNPLNRFFLEKLDTTGQLSIIDTNLIFKTENGYVESMNLGPAKKWSNILPLINSYLDSSSVVIDIIGYNRFTFKDELFKSIKNPNYIDLSDLNAYDYPYIRLKANIYSNKYLTQDKSGSFSGFTLSFVPSNEYAILKSQTNTLPSNSLRGDSLEYTLNIEGLSKRIMADSVDFHITAGNNINIIDKIDGKSNIIPINSQFNYSQYKFNDKYYAGNNLISFSINDSLKFNEFYYFNNKYFKQINVEEDNQKPRLKVFADSIEIQNKDFVQIKPFFEVEIYDNSRLPINDIKDYSYRLNGKWKSLKNEKYISFGREINKKGKFSFRTDSLEYGENLLFIYSIDANGNKDTLELKLNVSLNGSVDNLLNWPNPFVDITYFKFDYKAPILKGNAKIELFDYTGKLINKLSYDIRIGNNDMFWDGKDMNGNSLPQGFYLYKITITNDEDIFIEPIYGKLMIIR